MFEREVMVKNIAESIRAVAEHIAENAEVYAAGVDDHTQGLTIKAKFQINCLPCVTVKNHLMPMKYFQAVQDGRCRIWTENGRRELYEENQRK